MVNPEHVKILKQGVDVWNKWREKNPKIKPYLSGINLWGADLRKASLSDADFSYADLSDTDLSGANLSNADLSNANLKYADLSDADFSYANLREAKLSRASLSYTNLRKTNLNKANLSSAHIRNTDLSDADLSNANLNNANLGDTYLRKANLSNVNLSDANLSDANFTGVILYRSFRDEWKIEGIKCDYIYWDKEGKERTPKDRDFLPGEFEELYKWRPLDNFEKLIRRSIKFPAEYKQAGTSILNYFSEILYKKYPEANATVQIKQDGLKVTMIVDPVDGEREIIEKVLNEYGLVVTGKMTPEAFTDDRFLIMDLQNQLTFAKAQIENQARMLQFQNEDIKKKDIRIDRFLDIMESAMQRPENIHINNVNGSDVGIIGDKAKSEGGIHFNK